MSRSGSAAPLLSTPIQLCTYSIPRTEHTYHLCSTSSSTTRRSHVAVGDVVRLSSRGSLRRRRGLVVVLEQGVEVALVDMQTQTPVHTYTLAPSDRVCTPPLVVERSMPTTKQLVRTTYLGVLQDDHTQVRAFTESLDSRGKHIPGAEAHAPFTWDVPGALTGLYALGNGQLLAAAHGALHLVSDPLAGAQVLATHANLPTDLHDIQVWDADGTAGVVAMAATSDEGAHMYMLRVEGASFRSLECSLPLTDAVVSCALEQHGSFAVLTRHSVLHTVSWHVDDDRLVLDEPHEVALRPLDEARLVYVSPSHLLMVVAVPSDAERTRASTLLWDTDVDAVLAVTEWSTQGPPHISTTRAMDGYVFVQLDPKTSRSSKCTVAALPVSVPATGLLLHALGASSRTTPWLAAAPPELMGRAPDLLAALSSLPQDALSRAAAVDAQVRSWLDAQSEALREASHTKAGRKAPKVPLDAAVVTHLLDAALPPLGTETRVYARDTVRYLVENGAVSTSLMPDLVLRARQTGDWSLAFLLLRHVPDMSESHAVLLLRDALQAARRHEDEAPAFPRVLQHVLLPPAFSKPALRVALRTHLQHDDDALLLLDVLRLWIDLHMSSPWDPVPRTPDMQRAVPSSSLTYRTGSVQPPSLDACISFMEDLLDTFFPQWLSAPAMHPILREWTRTLHTHTHMLQLLSRLKAPLASVAQARTPEHDPRSRRLALHEASLLVPTYSVETLDM